MKSFFAILFLFSTYKTFCQPSTQSAEYITTDTAFIYYWNESGPSIAFIQNPHSAGTFNDFSTNHIKFGIPCSLDGMRLDFSYLAKKYGKVYKLRDYDSLTLTIIPVEIKYKVYSYNVSKKHFRQNQGINKFKLPDRIVKIRVYDKMSIQKLSIKPLEGYN